MTHNEAQADPDGVELHAPERPRPGDAAPAAAKVEGHVERALGIGPALRGERISDVPEASAHEETVV